MLLNDSNYLGNANDEQVYEYGQWYKTRDYSS